MKPIDKHNRDIITDDEYKQAIKECAWLSDNRMDSFGNVFKGICMGLHIPCDKAIDSGQCPTVNKLLNIENNYG